MLRKADTAGGFDPLITLDASVTSPSRRMFRLDGSLEALALSPQLHRLMLTMARVKNVYSSMRIEGIDVDLDEARRVVDSGTAINAPQRMVLRFANEYAQIHDTPEEELPRLTTEWLVELHGRLLKDDPDLPRAHLGVLKPAQNWINDRSSGEAIFEPTPPERTEAELDALFAWFESQADVLPAPVVAATFFAELQSIHPFADGNGRIGRLVNLIVLRKLGLRQVAVTPLDGRFFETQDRYYEKLRATNQGAWHVWNRYYCKQLLRAYEIAVGRGDLRPVLEKQRGAVARQLLEWILAGDGSWFKRADYPNASNHSAAAITGALSNLRRQGIVESRGERRGTEHRLATVFLRQAYGRDFVA